MDESLATKPAISYILWAGLYVNQRDEKQNLSKDEWARCDPNASMQMLLWGAKVSAG